MSLYNSKTFQNMPEEKKIAEKNDPDSDSTGSKPSTDLPEEIDLVDIFTRLVEHDKSLARATIEDVLDTLFGVSLVTP